MKSDFGIYTFTALNSVARLLDVWGSEIRQGAVDSGQRERPQAFANTQLTGVLGESGKRTAPN